MQREMRRRGGGFGFDEDRVQVFDAAGTFVPGPAPDVQGERVLAVGVVAVNEEVVSARDIATGVADDAREPSPCTPRHLVAGSRPWCRRSQAATPRGFERSRPLHRLAGRAAVNREALGGDPWMPAAYAEGQPWTRDPRGPRVQGYSPRIPHGKVTMWQSSRISACQGVIIG